MAAPIVRKCKTVTWQARAIVHAQSVSIAIEGDEQMARGDGATAAQIAWVENVHARITVNALEGSHTDPDVLPGAGALVATLMKQAAGAGDGAADQIWTFAEATFKGQKRGHPLDGKPTIDYEYVAVAASGLAADLFAIT